jgi:phosphoglycolate phosphatase-like HAD superfamily hydrolase
LLAALNALNVTRAESVYVGDSSVDFRVSQAAGVPFLLARYGYADPPLLELDQSQLEGFESPKDLPRVIARRMGVSRL